MKTPLLLAGSMLFLLFIEFVPAPVAAQSPAGPVAEIYIPDADFDSVFVGSGQWPSCASIQNIGTEDLICQITSSNPAFPVESNGVSIVIPPGEGFYPCFSFKPLAPGFTTGTMQITTNDPQAPEVTAIVTGTGLEPPIPDTLLTHTLQAGTTATGQIVIKNTTIGRARVSLFAYSYNLPETFLTFSEDGFYLNPGQSLPVNVYFNATELVPGFYDETFLIITVQPGDGDFLPLEIPVTMTVEPDPNDPPPYGPVVGDMYGMEYKDFDSTFINTSTYPKCFGFTNVGDEPLKYFIKSSSPEFTVTTTDTITLLPGESAMECVWFSPTKGGSASGAISITTNDTNHDYMYFYMTGFAYEAPVNITQITDTIHIGDVMTYPIQIKNTTPNKAHFHLQEDPLHDFLKLPVRSFTLDPGQSVTTDIVVDFRGPGYEDVESPGAYRAGGEITIDYDPFFGWDEAESIKVSLDITLLGTALINTPESLQIETSVSSLEQSSFTIGNTGGTPLTYSITTDAPVATGIRTYHTGFEDFQPGMIHGHHGWYAAEYVFYQNDPHWNVETTNPFSGAHHMRCTTDSDYISSLYSPPGLETTGDVSSIEMMVDVNPGVQWAIAANQYVALVILPDGSLNVTDDLISEDFQPIHMPLPEGYFRLQFSIRSSTREYFIKVNDQFVFTGTSIWLTSFNQVELSARYATGAPGSYLDLDDIIFTSGEEEIPLLSFEPVSGTIEELGTQTITVYTDTRNILPGEYLNTISIENNSLPEIATLPVTAIVKENIAPVLTGPVNIEMVSGDTLTLNYRATDADDSFIFMEGLNFVGQDPNWMEVTDSGNGFMTCKVFTFDSSIDTHQIGMIKATDSRGGIGSIIFDIHILAYKQNDFALTFFKTGQDEAVFTDTIVVDIAHPDLTQLTIQFKPGYGEGEGVKFILDGVQTNIDRKKPYYINSWLLPNLSEGFHNLTAQSFYTWEGIDYVLATRKVIVQVINSAAITDFDVVNANGVKLMDLENGSIIDVSKPGYDAINIVANTSIHTVKSVRFLGGTTITARIDNRAPYALKGNANGSDTFWNPTPGDYTYTAIPYMQYYGWGPKGIPLTVSFKVIRSTTSATARASEEKEETLAAESEYGENSWSVYPIPVKDDLTIQLNESVRGNISLQIINVQGINFYSQSGTGDTFQNQTISTVRLGMNPGVYFVILQHQDGKRSVKKIFKE